MSEEQTKTKPEKTEQSDDVKQALEDSKSPDEKHEAYKKRLETIANEP